MVPLRTVRLEIDLLGIDDAAGFAAYRGIPEVAAYQSWTPDYSIADALQLFEGQRSAAVPPTEPGHWVQLAVRARVDGSLLGDVAIGRDAQPETYEVGVTFAPAHHGHGYAKEALAAVVDGLFAIAGAHRVIAHADERNRAVRTLLQRVGFRHESRAVEADWFKGEWTTLDTFALLAGDERRRPTPPPTS